MHFFVGFFGGETCCIWELPVVSYAVSVFFPTLSWTVFGMDSRSDEESENRFVSGVNISFVTCTFSLDFFGGNSLHLATDMVVSYTVSNFL